MSQLCLKWNNHSSAFLKSICNIQIKERYCDATIVCQGTYFPVHRIILSTCSEYFEEIFERMHCQHPYIVFKDIEPREMELLLNYMYQGEVNVLQETISSLIRAAEALRIKGLAVPDDLPTSKEFSSGKKRSSSSHETPQPKRRAEESKRRQFSSNIHSQTKTSEGKKYFNSDIVSESSENLKRLMFVDHQVEDNEQRIIKEEPLDSEEYGDGIQGNKSGALLTDSSKPPLSSKSVDKDDTVFVDFSLTDSSSTCIKEEEAVSTEEPFEHQSSVWGDFSCVDVMQNLHPGVVGRDDDDDNDDGDGMPEMNQGMEESGSNVTFQTNSRTCQQNKGDRAFMRRTLSSSKRTKRTSPLTYKCPYCSYEGYRTNQIKTHIMFKHTGERPFSCSLCSKRFVEKIGLDRHMRSHTGEKPYVCSFCSKKFSQKVNLKAHMNKKHP